MPYSQEVKSILTEVRNLAHAEGKKTGFCIGNTAKVDPQGFYFTPIRNVRLLVAGSVIVYEAHFAEAIAQAIDGEVEYIFIDTEKKVGPDIPTYGPSDLGNIERVVRNVIKSSTVLTFKGNDLTVDSIDCLLSQSIGDPVRGIGGKKIAIIGAGNMGSKLALKLVERGAQVVLTRRSKEELDVIVQALNYIKPKYTAASVVGTTDNVLAATQADILIGMSNGTPVITEEMIDVLNPGSLIMDGGKGCLTPQAITRAVARSLDVFRVDIRAGFEGHVAMILEMERLLSHSKGRREVNGVWLVSSGLLARCDEVVVDNVADPKIIYGIADGSGDFVRQLSEHQVGILRIAKECICGTTAN